jgi:uncharacterized protein YndB with AHSA1/START domain
MEDYMDKIIHCKVRLNCNQKRSFEMFTNNSDVQSWLAELADIEPYVGGKYELFWDPDNKTINSTIDCKITAVDNNKLLCFEWKGPVQFEHIMNKAVPLTHVSVLFLPDDNNDNSTEVHLIHTGWGSDEDWEKARRWFDSVWTNALESLKSYVN